MNNIYKVTIAALICMNISSVNAQDIKGYIYEFVSSNPIWNATIKNTRTNEVVQSQKDGSFSLKGQINDYLVVSNRGYTTDTVFYYENAIRRIYMDRDEKLININEVLVKRLTDSRLAAEIAKAENESKRVETSKTKGGLRISPSRVFGESAKEARKNLSLLLSEQNNRKIDRVLTTQLISSLTPLSQDEIALFREQFRPSYEFVQKASPEDIRIYILDSYKKFKKN